MSLDIDGFIGDLQKSPRTKIIYRYALQQFDRFLDGKKPTEKLAREFIRNLHDDGNAPATITTKGYAIRRYFRWAGKRLDLELPPVRVGPPKYLLEDQVMRLMETASDIFERVLIMILYETGMRVGELLGITRKDINWETGVIHIIRKGGHEGWVAVGPETIAAMKEYDQWRKTRPNQFFPYKYSDVRIWFMTHAERAGLGHVTLHQLRHSRAANLRLAGQPLEDISELLGHRSLTTTAKIYSQIGAAPLKERLARAPWEKTEGGG